MEASSARVAAVLRSLEAKGMIERSVDDKDRRRILVSITDAGRALVQDRRCEIRDYFYQIILQLGERDVCEGYADSGADYALAESLEKETPETQIEIGGNDLAG